MMFPKPEPRKKSGLPCAICRMGVSTRRAKTITVAGRQQLVHEKCLKRSLGGSTNKYGAKKAERAGRSFDSGAEAKVFDYLTMLQSGGDILDLKCQVRLHYRSDFQYYDVHLRRTITAEVKGFEGERWRVIRQLWLDVGPTPLWVYRVDDGGGITIMRKIRGGKEEV